ncbi:MAG: vWA domain-containing protein, partial [Bacteroidia bacterium]|nr:VWA domain-containing protein [Bacteroidia bacterium]MDW8157582.1 vWA domain-containing protein [Bacteroidia bacterium]
MYLLSLCIIFLIATLTSIIPRNAFSQVRRDCYKIYPTTVDASSFPSIVRIRFYVDSARQALRSPLLLSHLNKTSDNEGPLCSPRLIPANQLSTPQKIDVVFVVDNSAGMRSIINEVGSALATLHSGLELANLKPAYGLCTFGYFRNNGEPVAAISGTLFENFQVFSDLWQTANQAAGSREPAYDAIVYALENMQWRKDAIKLIILIMDEAPDKNENQNRNSLAQVINAIRNNYALFYSLTPESDPITFDFIIPQLYPINSNSYGENYAIKLSQLTQSIKEAMQHIPTSINNSYILEYQVGCTNPDGLRNTNLTIERYNCQSSASISYQPTYCPYMQLSPTTYKLLNEFNATITNRTEIQVAHSAPLQNQVYLYWRALGATQYQKVPLAFDTNNGFLGATIPPKNFEFYLENQGPCYFTFPAKNPTQNPIRIHRESRDTFFILHNTPDYPFPPNALTMQAKVVSNQTERAELWGYYRLNGQGEYIPIQFNHIGNNIYTTSLPASWFSQYSRIDYYITAYIPTNQKQAYWGTEINPKRFYKTKPGFDYNYDCPSTSAKFATLKLQSDLRRRGNYEIRIPGRSNLPLLPNTETHIANLPQGTHFVEIFNKNNCCEPAYVLPIAINCQVPRNSCLSFANQKPSTIALSCNGTTNDASFSYLPSGGNPPYS